MDKDHTGPYIAQKLDETVDAMLNSKVAHNEFDSDDIKLLKSHLCESLKKRFSYLRNTLQLSIATLIDPRFKDKYLTNNDISNAKTGILAFLRQNYKPRNQAQEMDVDVDVDEPSCSTSNTSGNIPPKDDLWDTHDQKPLSVTEFEDSNASLLPFEEQLISYLKEPLLLRAGDIFHYWASSPYNYLRLIANKYLSAPPTSVPSEQLFSAAGQIYD